MKYEPKFSINFNFATNSSIMEILAALFILALLLGLLFRKKGDGFLDTIQSGCWIIIILGLLGLGYFLYLNFN